MDSYNVNDHIEFRRKNLTKANISNPNLPGLSLVEVNPTELCNRTCSFCPRSNPNIYPNLNLNMSLETASILSDQLYSSNFDGEIAIIGFGEPTLNKKILDIIKLFSNRFFTSMVSNGDKFLSGKIQMEEVIESGLSSLIVDCYDGLEHYKKIEKLLAPYSDKINLKIRNTFDDGSSDLFSEHNFNNRGGILGGVKSLQRPCNLPMYKVVVDWNGDVILCCNDWARKEKGLGSILSEDFSKLWTSERFNNIRKELINGNRNEIPACSGCNVDGTLAGNESFNFFKDIL